MSSLTILVSGMTCSGKTTFASRLCEEWNATVLSLDDYFVESDPEALDVTNFEHPSCVDVEALCHDLRALQRGQVVDVPVYGFRECRRIAWRRVDPSALIVVEGQHAGFHDSVVSMATASVYLDVPVEICFTRRFERDVVHLSRSRSAFLRRWRQQISPTYDQCRSKIVDNADLILCGSSVTWMSSVQEHLRGEQHAD